MPIEAPTPKELRDVAEGLGLTLSDEDLETFRGLMGASIAAFNAVDGMDDGLPAVKYPREAGTIPTPDDNPLNAWYVKTSVKGADSGPLNGRTVALKDNIMLAGVPP